MKQTPVRKLANEHLLNEYAGLERWAGDDFAVHQITPNAIRRKRAARDEILKRMNSASNATPRERQ